jgi:hypothetical protein
LLLLLLTILWVLLLVVHLFLLLSKFERTRGGFQAWSCLWAPYWSHGLALWREKWLAASAPATAALKCLISAVTATDAICYVINVVANATATCSVKFVVASAAIFVGSASSSFRDHTTLYSQLMIAYP